MGEFNSGHLKNALQADWNNQIQFKERIQHVDKDKPVYIYCLSGTRSRQAANWMRNSGFTNVVELKGGINLWKRNGKKLESAANEKQMTIEEYQNMIPADKTILVDFGADWCPPCLKMKPALDEVLNEAGDKIKFLKIDAGVHTDILKEMNVDALPVFIIYKNGKQVWRKDGIADKNELLQQLF